MNFKNKRKPNKLLILFVTILIIICYRYNFRQSLDISLTQIRFDKNIDSDYNSLLFSFDVKNPSYYNTYILWSNPNFPKELEPYIEGWENNDSLCDYNDTIDANTKQATRRIVYLKKDDISDEVILELAKKVNFKFTYISYKNENPFSFAVVKQYLR